MTTDDHRPARLPIADVRVTLHSIEDGEAEVAVAIDPDGALGGAYGTADERFAALQLLFEAVQRELADALDTLADGDGDGDGDGGGGDAPTDDEPAPGIGR